MTSCVAVIGGGNGAHAAVPILAQATGARVQLCSPFADEAERLAAGAHGRAGLRAYGAGVDACCRPALVTADPVRAVTGADLVLLVVPAFAHGALLDTIMPHLEPGAVVGALPARGGFEFDTLTRLAAAGRDDLTFIGLDTLPWACRIARYGEEVEVLGSKRRLALAASPAGRARALAAWFGRVLGTTVEPLPDFTTLTLANMGQVIHPGIMYGLLGRHPDPSYASGQVPLFYQSVDDYTATVLDALSREVQRVAAALNARSGAAVAGGPVPHVSEWLAAAYPGEIEDRSGLAAMFATNRAYRGLLLPTRPGAGGRLVPDFGHRYLNEDVPFGLVVTKGLAVLVGVATPVIDEVVATVSVWLGREYLESGQLRGRDLPQTRCPQRYGIDNLERLLAVVSSHQAA